MADPSGLGAGQFLARTGPFSGFDWAPSDFETQLRRPAVRYQANATWLDDQVLSAGYDYYSETMRSTSCRRSRTTPTSYSSSSTSPTPGSSPPARVSTTTLTTARRSIRSCRQEGTPLPFQEGPLSSLKVSANIGRGIKNPSFSQLYSSQWTDGNLLLLPEQAVTVDAGARAHIRRPALAGTLHVVQQRLREPDRLLALARFRGDGVPGLRQHRRVARRRRRA